MAAKRKYSAPGPTEWRTAERGPAEGEEAAWARAVGAPEVVYDRIRDRERALGAGRRWMTEDEGDEELGEDEEDEEDEDEDDDDEEGPEGYHCQICGYHTDQLQPFNVHLHSAHPTVVLQELYGLLGLTAGLAPGLGSPGGLAPGLGPPGGLAPGLGPPGGLAPGLGPPGGLAPGLGPPGGLAPGLGPPGGLAPGLGPPGGLAPGLGPPGGLAPGLGPPGGLAPGLGPPGGLAPGLGPPGGLAPGQGPPVGLAPGLGPPGCPVPCQGRSGGPSAGPVRRQGGKVEGGRPDIVHIDLTGEDEVGEQGPGHEEEEEEEEAEAGPGPAPAPAPAPSLKQPAAPSRELAPGLEPDAEGPLAEAFSRFPYPSPDELARCGLSAGLPAERVRVWFAVQRLRHGISWTPEEVREARDKLWRKPGTLRLPVPPLALLADRPPGLAPAPGPTGSRASAGLGEAPDGAPRGGGGPLPGSPKRARTSPDGADSPEAPGCPARALPLPGERRWRKTKGQLATLKGSFARDRYPDEAEMQRLQARTGLGKPEIKRWFSDSRYQLRGLPASYFQLRRAGVPAWQRNGRPLPRAEVGGEALDRLGQVSPAAGGGGADSNQRKAEVGGRAGEEEGEEEEEEDSAAKALGLSGSSAVAVVAAAAETASASRAQASSQAPAPSPGRPRKTKEQLAVLKAFFLRSQWPSGDDYTRLVEQTALARADIIQWFGDTRYALKNGQLKWVHRGSTAFVAAGPGTEAETGPGPGPGADCGPLEEYASRHGGRLRQDDLYRLCVETRMSAQQVAEWFRRRRRPRPLEPEDGGSEEDRPAEEGGGGGPGERQPDHVGGHIVRVTL